MNTTIAHNSFAGAAELLGGIDALFNDTGPQYSLIPLGMIEVKAQIRETFEDDENTLEDLAASIKARGLLQPILLRSTSDGYELIAGERRYRASKLAGLEHIPAYIREMSDEEAEDAQMAENIHRKNLTQIEEAKKIQRDLDKLGSVDAVLERHQKGRPWLSKMLALLDLPEQTKRLVVENVSADIEVINTVKTVEKADPKKAKALVDDLKSTRGQANARKKAQAAKDEVKPKKPASSGIMATPKDRSNEEPGEVKIFSHAKIEPTEDKFSLVSAPPDFEEGTSPEIFAHAKKDGDSEAFVTENEKTAAQIKLFKDLLQMAEKALEELTYIDHDGTVRVGKRTDTDVSDSAGKALAAIKCITAQANVA